MKFSNLSTVLPVFVLVFANLNVNVLADGKGAIISDVLQSPVNAGRSNSESYGGLLADLQNHARTNRRLGVPTLAQQHAQAVSSNGGNVPAYLQNNQGLYTGHRIRHSPSHSSRVTPQSQETYDQGEKELDLNQVN